VSATWDDAINRKCKACAADYEVALQAARAALEAAARSLETLSCAGSRGDNRGLEVMADVRGYAASRASVARDALQALAPREQPRRVRRNGGAA
jgi:hypothetical protein